MASSSAASSGRGTTRQNAVGFQMVMLQKLLASSSRALLTSLLGRRMRLLGDARASELTRMPLRRPGRGRPGRRTQSRTSRRCGSDIPNSNDVISQLKQHRDRLEDQRACANNSELLFADPNEPDAKVLIFTEFRETQDMLAERAGALGRRERLPRAADRRSEGRRCHRVPRRQRGRRF